MSWMEWERPGPQKLLDVALRRRIGVVVSAAGWGKTTALRAWTRRRWTWPAHITENAQAARTTLHPDSLRRVDQTLVGFEVRGATLL